MGDPFAVPLYEGADLSIFDSYFLAFQFSVRHCLTSTELLNLLRVHVPTSAKVAKSLYRLKKYFLQLFPHAKCTTHRYCSCCFSPENEEGNCPTSTTAGSCDGGKMEEFVSIPLGPQLKNKFEGNYVAIIIHVHRLALNV